MNDAIFPINLTRHKTKSSQSCKTTNNLSTLFLFDKKVNENSKKSCETIFVNTRNNIERKEVVDHDKYICKQ